MNYQPHDLADHLLLSATRSDEGEAHRLNRLSNVVCLAAGYAVAAHKLPSPTLMLSTLRGVHDHKGVLSCLWTTGEAEETFGPYLTQAWGWSGEATDSVKHFTDELGTSTAFPGAKLPVPQKR